MIADIWAKIMRFVDAATERSQRNIMPTENDRVWFERNKKSKNGWPRQYRVRESVASDHWVLKVGEHSPIGFITIITRNPPIAMAVVSAGEDMFGPVTNSDEYARMRLEHLTKELDEADAKRVSV
jgi:hypothetical protein